MQHLLPVFAYGTLRLGYGNHRTFGGAVTDVTPATISGAIMTTIGFPYVALVDDPTKTVYGELMTIDPARYNETLRSVDALEGYRGPGAAYNHYNRNVVTVQTLTGEDVEAWMYTVSEESALQHRLVPSGDFADAVRPRIVADFIARV